MKLTPEGMVKSRVRELLNRYKGVYYYMPVSNGMGAPSLDFLGCNDGLFFAIETKAEGKNPTERQLITIKQMQEAGAAVFVIQGCDDRALAPLRLWLEFTSGHSHQSPETNGGRPLPG
jgi:hypothetical protein